MASLTTSDITASPIVLSTPSLWLQQAQQECPVTRCTRQPLSGKALSQITTRNNRGTGLISRGTSREEISPALRCTGTLELHRPRAAHPTPAEETGAETAAVAAGTCKIAAR